MPSSMVPWPTKLTTCTPRDWPMRCTRPMRCSSTAGFHGRSMFTTTDAACCRFRPTPPASVDRNRRHRGIVVKALDQRAALLARHAAEQHMAPVALALALPRRRRISSCVRSHWLKTTTLACRVFEQLVEQRHQLVDLVAVVGLVVEQVGAVAGHAHVLQGDLQPPLVGVRQEAGLAPALDDARDDVAVLVVVHTAAAASSARRCGCPPARAAAVSTSALRRRSIIGASVWPMRSRPGSR